MLKSNSVLTYEISSSIVNAVELIGELSCVNNAVSTNIIVQEKCVEAYNSAKTTANSLKLIVKNDAAHIKEKGISLAEADSKMANEMGKNN